MTLERHKSKLIPDVDFSGDGRIFVTDRQGTFPLRGGQAKDRGRIEGKDWTQGKDGQFDRDGTKWGDQDDLPPPNQMHRYVGDVGSYHSYDPKRDRKYQPKELSNYQKAMREVTGTVSSKSSNSLSRKLKRTKSEKFRREYEGRYGSSGSLDRASTGSGRRFRAGKPRRMAEIERDSRQYSSLDIQALRKLQRRGKARGYENNNYLDTKNRPPDMNGYIHEGDRAPEFIPRLRRISDEKLPAIPFILLGLLVFVAGLILLLFSHWHIYYCLLWTGFLVFCLGIAGVFHKKDYTSGPKNVVYIVLGMLCAIATMSVVALSLPILVPSLQHIAGQSNLTSSLLSEISFTYQEDPLVVLSSLSSASLLYLTVGTVLAGLLFSSLAFFSLTAMLLALDNFWDACYLTTGECDHRGNPRFFNPLEQMSLAQATMFMGLLSINLQVPSYLTYWSPFWAPFLILLSGFCSLCAGKRPDLSSIGGMSVFMQLCGVLASGVSTVLCTLSLVRSIETLRLDKEEYRESELIVSISLNAVYILLVIVNIVFAVGVVFRHIRQMCCTDCMDGLDDPHDPYLPHDTKM